MVGALLRVMVCSPRTAGWDQPERVAQWRELGFRHAPDFATSQSQHENLCRELRNAGAEIVELPAANQLSMDAAYAHDASLATDFGLIAMRPGKANREVEGAHHARFAAELGIPVLASIAAPGTTEAGDILWLDSKLCWLVMATERTLRAFSSCGRYSEPKGVDVISAPLPYGAGPSECLHLMSLISLLDEKTALVDLAWLAVETVELLKARGYRWIEIDPSERETLACNVLALGENRVLAIEENRKTNERLRRAGFDVRIFPGSEVCINGSGGPTCLTRPLLRS